MYENIKVIVCDIDGTLCETTCDPNEYTLNVIRKLKDNNYKIALASGRAYDDLLTKASRWGLEFQFDFLIGLNGCQLYDDEDKKLYEYNCLTPNELKEIISIMQEFNPNIHMYKPGIYLSSKETDRAWYSAFKNKRIFTVAKSLEEFYDNNYPGIMFRVEAKQMPKIEEKVSLLKNKNYKGFKTQDTLFEFTNINSSKAYALKKYCQMKNIDMNDVMAFGDTSNDNEMLECCHGICLLNGSADTKAICERVTDKTVIDDGFGHFVEDYVL